MLRLGEILQQPNRGEQESFRSAAALDLVNHVLREELEASEHEVRAVAIHHGTAVVRVSHGAAAGIIRANHDRFLELINRRLQDRYPKAIPITRLACRTR